MVEDGQLITGPNFYKACKQKVLLSKFLGYWQEMTGVTSRSNGNCMVFLLASFLCLQAL